MLFLLGLSREVCAHKVSGFDLLFSRVTRIFGSCLFSVPLAAGLQAIHVEGKKHYKTSLELDL